MDLAQALNRPEIIRFGGREFPVRQLRLSEWAALQAWLKRAHPSPVTAAALALQEARERGLAVGPDVADLLLNHAQASARKWPPAVASAEWLRALDAAEGGTALFVQTVLAAGGTDVTAAEAAGLAEASSQDEFDELMRAAFCGDAPAPKAGRAEAPPGTTPGPMTGPESSAT
jgi:hypothetical protein